MRAVTRGAVVLQAALALSAVLLSAAPAAAQRPDSLPARTVVRVTPTLRPARQVVGAIESADSLRFRVVTRQHDVVEYPYDAVASVEVARGMTRVPGAVGRGARRGFLVGATIGLVATGAALAYDFHGGGEAFVPASLLIGAYSVAFTGVTTVAGALIGSVPRTNWERVWGPRD